MTKQEKIDKILEVIKNIPLEKWSNENYYATEINGIKVRTYYRINGNPPGVEVGGEEIWGTKVEATNDIYYSVEKYFNSKEVYDKEQKIGLLYDKLCDGKF